MPMIQMGHHRLAINMFLDYCLNRTRLLSDWTLLLDLYYYRTCPISGCSLASYRHFSYLLFPCFLSFLIFSVFVHCVLMTSCFSHRFMHLVLFHPPAVFSSNRFTAGGRSFILLNVVLVFFLLYVV